MATLSNPSKLISSCNYNTVYAGKENDQHFIADVMKLGTICYNKYTPLGK
jgi:hypothetical protein